MRRVLYPLCPLLALGLAVSSQAGVREVVERADEAVLTLYAGDHSRRVVGSAVIVNPAGYALTNAHVVIGADRVTAVLKDNRSFHATIIQRDDKLDIALIRLPAANLPSVAIGDVAKLRTGDDVVAIGAPHGLDHTVTRGIVSNVDRRIRGSRYIQTDAAINPGNSGGPLLNERSEVVGINTFKDNSAQGVGFAVPIDLASRLLRRAGVAVATPLSNRALSASKNYPEPPTTTDGRQIRPPRGAIVVIGFGIGLVIVLDIVIAIRAHRRRRALREPEITLHPPVHEEDDLEITLT